MSKVLEIFPKYLLLSLSRVFEDDITLNSDRGKKKHKRYTFLVLSYMHKLTLDQMTLPVSLNFHLQKRRIWTYFKYVITPGYLKPNVEIGSFVPVKLLNGHCANTKELREWNRNVDRKLVSDGIMTAGEV